MFYINGTGYTNNSHGKKPRNLTLPNNIPEFDKKGRLMQIFLSNLTLTSVL